MEADGEGRPFALQLPAQTGAHRGGRRLTVEERLEAWRIDDEWWRERPVSRQYWRLLLADGRTVDVYQGLAGGRWFRQAY